MADHDLYGSNKSFFSQASMGAHYARRNFLHASEEFILTEHSEWIASGPLLDVGVGAGRTAPSLAAASGQYVGLDYSEEMIKKCRLLYPQFEFRHGDAMHLTDFEDETFATVFFSANGIDYVTLPDRLRMITELKRVLKPGGLFVFSSRNLNRSQQRNPYRFKGFTFEPNPLRLLQKNAERLRGYLLGIRNFRRHRPLEQHGDGWAILAEPIHSFSTVMYCSTMRYQVKQLEDLGFETTRVVSFGSYVETLDVPLEDPWLYYVAIKVS